MQRVIGEFDGRFDFLDLPDPNVMVLEDVRWDSFEHPLTPAFWVAQSWLSGNAPKEEFQLGRSLEEEVVYCLLGGYGNPAEIGLAAARRMCSALPELCDAKFEPSSLEKMLARPLTLAKRSVRYRFAAQRAKYLAGALTALSAIDEADLGDVALRERLRNLPGIGFKTASWIVRNRRASDEVAILDVHIVRACKIMRIFPRGADPARHYLDLERRFLEFCRRTGSAASRMDAVMWSTMRAISQRLMQQLVDADGVLRKSSENNLSVDSHVRLERLAG